MKIFLILINVLLLAGCQTLSVSPTTSPNLFKIAENLTSAATKSVEKTGYKDERVQVRELRDFEVAVNNPNWFKARYEHDLLMGGWVRGFAMYNVSTHRWSAGSLTDNLKFDQRANIKGWRPATELDAIRALQNTSSDLNQHDEYLANAENETNKSIYEKIYVYENSTAVVKIHGPKRIIKVKSDGKHYDYIYNLIKSNSEIDVGFFVRDNKIKPKRYEFHYEPVTRLKARIENGVKTIIVKDHLLIRKIISNLSGGKYLYLSAKETDGDRFKWWRLEKTSN